MLIDLAQGKTFLQGIRHDAWDIITAVMQKAGIVKSLVYLVDGERLKSLKADKSTKTLRIMVVTAKNNIVVLLGAYSRNRRLYFFDDIAIRDFLQKIDSAKDIIFADCGEIAKQYFTLGIVPEIIKQEHSSSLAEQDKESYQKHEIKTEETKTNAMTDSLDQSFKLIPLSTDDAKIRLNFRCVNGYQTACAIFERAGVKISDVSIVCNAPETYYKTDYFDERLIRITQINGKAAILQGYFAYGETEIYLPYSAIRAVLSTVKSPSDIMECTLSDLGMRIYSNKAELPANDSLGSRNDENSKVQEIVDENTKHDVREEKITASQLRNDEWVYSFCKGYKKEDGTIRLKRMSDVQDDVITDIIFPGTERFNLLFARDTFISEDFYGVWKWRAVPNKSDSVKKYIESEFQSGYELIEVIEIDAENDNDLIRILKQGIAGAYDTNHVLFAYLDENEYRAFYCQKKKLMKTDNKLYVKESVAALQRVQLRSEDIIQDNGRKFFRRFSVTLLDDTLQLCDPANWARDALIQRATWQYCKQRGCTKKEYQFIRDFFAELPEDSLIHEISVNGNCPEDIAANALHKFMDQAVHYLEGTTEEQSVLLDVVRANPELLARVQDTIRIQWEQENQKQITDANQKLLEISEDISSKKKELHDCEEKAASAQKTLDLLNEEVENKKLLAEKVEEAVQQRIHSARGNMAQFIAEFPYLGGAAAAKPSSDSKWIAGAALSADEVQVSTNWKELLSVLEDELPEAGVMSERAPELAAFLLSAWSRRVPLFLAGPNAAAIADALSAALYGRLADRIHCGEQYSAELAEQAERAEGRIVVLDQPIHTQWENKIAELLENGKCFWIVTAPFAEDLLLEPRGLWNYVLPICTEVFVETCGTRSYLGGYLAENFKMPAEGHTVNKFKGTELLRGLSPSANRKIAEICTGISAIGNGDNWDALFLTVGYSLAFLCERQEAFRKLLTEKERILKQDTVRFLMDAIGEAE